MKQKLRSALGRRTTWVVAAVLAFFAGRALQLVVKAPATEKLEVASTKPSTEKKSAPREFNDLPVRASSVGSGKPIDDEEARLVDMDYYPRPSTEWQGYRVSRLEPKSCRDTQDCHRGLACIDAKCGACSNDRDCLERETCVLDHCISVQRAGCKTTKDCSQREMCVLVGSTSGSRGNESLRAVCNPDQGENMYHVPPTPGKPVGPQHSDPPVQSDLVAEFERAFQGEK
jgi:hypothetical protein